MMASTKEILELTVEDGELPKSDWPLVREAILQRLDEIIYTQFPIPISPTLLPSEPTPDHAEEPSATQTEEASSQISTSDAANKENAPPSSPPQPTRPPVPTFATSQVPKNNNSHNGTLPLQLADTYNYVRRALTHQFVSYPPHTVQRLAELVLKPKEHYKYLPAYLNALDRVLSVTSGTDRFPPVVTERSAGNGNLANGYTTANTLGSDESLGGALLTPIPWLRHGPSTTSGDSESGNDTQEMVDSSSGNVEASLREDVAITQGELLRQEQASGVVPAPVVPTRQSSTTSHGAERDEKQKNNANSEEQPHARGPEEIGMSDLGPQEHAIGRHTLNMAAAVGRTSQGHKAEEKEDMDESYVMVEKPAESTATADSAGVDGDGDVELVDADGSAELDRKEAGAAGDDTAPDVVDQMAR